MRIDLDAAVTREGLTQCTSVLPELVSVAVCAALREPTDREAKPSDAGEADACDGGTGSGGPSGEPRPVGPSKPVPAAQSSGGAGWQPLLFDPLTTSWTEGAR